jgi:hypothetical protein
VVELVYSGSFNLLAASASVFLDIFQVKRVGTVVLGRVAAKVVLFSSL